ncbi:hypothetical protein SAY87_026138 [Trapa incisa]|uniref:Serine-rich protein-like protein n=2 Tax=Trapa TaxID=22665 RepID=A0AAN7LEA1_TRANT|nr:hypothetical protein SAY87_026138 [Trapa incisa]KAK4784977.1 hypothetical protein SAY86_001666 [Trapa natans]
MATSSRTRSSGSVLRSLSPSGRLRSPARESSIGAAASAFGSTSSGFSSPSSTYYHRSTSPTRVNLYTSKHLTPSVRFSIDRSVSPNRSLSVSSRYSVISNRSGSVKRTCMCSPTNHPGSFRCSLHKNSGGGNQQSVSFPSNRLNMLRSAMKNSIVRIGGVEGELMKRSLAALIRPSSHQQRRRAFFQPRPSRLSVMSKADDF